MNERNLKPDPTREGCIFCDLGEHHDLAMKELPVNTPTMRDALQHILDASYAALKDLGIPRERFLAVIEPVMEGMGWAMREAEREGQRHGVADFFQHMIDTSGYGTYQIELQPNTMHQIGRVPAPTNRPN